MTYQDVHSAKARLPALAGAALATLLVAGCSSADSTEGAELNGADAQVNVVEMEDLYLVALEEGEPARFLGTLVNQSAFPMDVTLSDADDEVMVTVPADSEFAFAENPTLFESADVTPGTIMTVSIAVGSDDESVEIPVVDGTSEEYRDFAPADPER
ncbi:hypothetical protein [Arthrobacter sp. H41]|uniref:hypothetical protein n=1 Tax=Arthrobacter sp. H41 TaxID=1312978 RepID=UPI000478A9B2|nr:hypothetical protein [Arthrobacter sp. H41]